MRGRAVFLYNLLCAIQLRLVSVEELFYAFDH